MRWRKGVRLRGMLGERWKRWKQHVKRDNILTTYPQSFPFVSPTLHTLSFPIPNTELNKWIFISVTPAFPKACGRFPPSCTHRILIASMQLETLLVFKEWGRICWKWRFLSIACVWMHAICSIFWCLHFFAQFCCGVKFKFINLPFCQWVCISRLNKNKSLYIKRDQTEVSLSKYSDHLAEDRFHSKWRLKYSCLQHRLYTGGFGQVIPFALADHSHWMESAL